MTITASKYTANQHPGKFEGEQPATEYFYEHMLDGDGETLYTHDDDAPSGTLFQIDADEAEAFGLPLGAYFLLLESTDGFVFGSVHSTKEATESAYQAWAA